MDYIMSETPFKLPEINEEVDSEVKEESEAEVEDLSKLPRIICDSAFNVKCCDEFIDDIKSLPEVTDIWFD